MPLDQVSNEQIEKYDPDAPEKGADEAEMSFLDHLEVLRWHLIRSLLGITICTIVAFVNGGWVFRNIIFAPARTDFWTYRQLCYLGELLNSPVLCIDKLNFILQSRTLSGQFFMHITASIVVGLVASFPYVFWEIWRFVKPGLHLNERKVARGTTFYVSSLFMIGTLFGYYVVAPLSINFLSSYQIDPSIQNEFDIISYVSTLITLVLACSLMFQLPVLVFFLARVGLITPAVMRKYRRHAVIVILVVAGVITPPDVFSQILISIPLMVLYEMSIGIARRVEKKYLQEIEMEKETVQK